MPENDQNPPDQGDGQPEQPEPAAAQPPAQAHGNRAVVALAIFATTALITLLAMNSARQNWQTAASKRLTKSQSDRIAAQYATTQRELHAFLHPPEPAANIRMVPPVEGVAFWESQRDGCAAEIRRAKQVGWHNQPYYAERDAAKAVGMCLTDLGLADKPPASPSASQGGPAATTTGKQTVGPLTSNAGVTNPAAVQGPPPAAEEAPASPQTSSQGGPTPEATAAPGPTEPSGPTDAGATHSAAEQADTGAALAAAPAPAPEFPSAPPLPMAPPAVALGPVGPQGSTAPPAILTPPPVVAAELTGDECGSVIEPHIAEIKACYNETVWPSLPNAQAQARIRFYVNTDGYTRLRDATASWNPRPRNDFGEINPDRFLGCVRNLAHEWRFPFPRRQQSICERTVSFDEAPPVTR